MWGSRAGAYYSGGESKYNHNIYVVSKLYEQIELCDATSPKYTHVLNAVRSLSEIALEEQANEHETGVLENTWVDFVALVGVRTGKLYTLQKLFCMLLMGGPGKDTAQFYHNLDAFTIITKGTTDIFDSFSNLD